MVRLRAWARPHLRILALGPLVFFLLPAAASALDPQKCAIVMFERDAMVLPVGVLQCSIDSAVVTPSSLEVILDGNGATIVGALIPDFEPADTLITTRFGSDCLVTDWSRVFLVEVGSAADVDSLIADLQGADGVVYADSSGERVASGVYFCKMTAGSFTATKKMVMLK